MKKRLPQLLIITCLWATNCQKETIQQNPNPSVSNEHNLKKNTYTSLPWCICPVRYHNKKDNTLQYHHKMIYARYKNNTFQYFHFYMSDTPEISIKWDFKPLQFLETLQRCGKVPTPQKNQ